jgi:glycosyltransferase involved in cell wall biosynthesis
VFVDDGSTDGTLAALTRLHAAASNVKVVRLRRNFGKAAALAAGFRHADGDVVVTIDADLQDDPEEIPRLLAKLDEGYDLVSGWKAQRRDPLSRRIFSRIFNGVVGRVSGLRLHDLNCGLKAYRPRSFATSASTASYIASCPCWPTTVATASPRSLSTTGLASTESRGTAPSATCAASSTS